MTDKKTSALIETLKANNEELLKQVALLTEQVAYLTNKLYGKSSEKRAVNPDQLSLFEEDGYCFSPKLSTSNRYVFSRS